MAKVTGIGGVFFKVSEPEALRDWYADHLGLQVDAYGYVVMRWGEGSKGSTVWAPFPDDTTYVDWPEQKQWMINYRVDDLDALLGQLREEGVQCDSDVLEDENGRFGHCWDPEGNRIELWQPAKGM